jgi:hypothetical protein
LNNRRTQNRRYLSTTPIRHSQSQAQAQTEAQSQQPEPAAEELEELPEEYYAPEPAEIQTRLVYPGGLTTAPSTSDVADPSYKPADSAEGLEEVGGLADWWEDPAHWGSEGGVTQFVRSVVSRFGPAEKVTDPAMLEVLAKRAIVEAIVVAHFGGNRRSKKVDQLFARADGIDWLGKVEPVKIMAGADGVATLKYEKDFARVWGALNQAAKAKQPEQQQGEKEAAEEGSVAVEAEASQEAATAEAEVKEAATPQELTPETARKLVKTWNQNKEWKKAELRDPVVKFFVSSLFHGTLRLRLLTLASQAAKRIQQLTGHRIPDGKLVAIGSIENLLKELVEPEKPKKLAELIETKGVFKELPNVRVFPRRVTPIDKEKMVGRWKIIVKELEKRDLPVIGTGDHGPPVEKKWIEGRA